ncbi:hypothetical protein OROGR_002124 [Orobanche gracilis]
MKISRLSPVISNQDLVPSHFSEFSIPLYSAFGGPIRIRENYEKWHMRFHGLLHAIDWKQSERTTEELKSAFIDHLNQVADLVEKLSAELRSGIGRCKILLLNEPCLIRLISFHVLLLLVAFFSRKNNFQMSLFLVAHMQDGAEEKLNPVRDFHSETEINQDLYSRTKLQEGNLQEDDLNGDDCEEEEQGEEDFSFNCGELSTSPVSAEDAFINGQIKPFFPIFNRNLAFSGGESNSRYENLPVRPPVKKIFVETSGDDNGTDQAMASSGPGNDEIVGPYCEWSSRKAVDASPDQACKKSNSTGFSKIWRFKEFVGRCNSDGSDAFVFLNNGVHGPPPSPSPSNLKKSEKTESNTGKIKKEVKKSGKSTKTESLSAHEVYLRSKVKEDDRRRSYLPYRPELMGFFTNVNGGLTKNIHPF